MTVGVTLRVRRYVLFLILSLLNREYFFLFLFIFYVFNVYHNTRNFFKILHEMIKLSGIWKYIWTARMQSRADAKIHYRWLWFTFSNTASRHLNFGLTVWACTWNELVATVMEAEWNTKNLLSSVLIHIEHFPREWNKVIKQSKSLEHSVICHIINNCTVTYAYVLPVVNTVWPYGYNKIEFGCTEINEVRLRNGSFLFWGENCPSGLLLPSCERSPTPPLLIKLL